mgnify:CR=1 FL=1
MSPPIPLDELDTVMSWGHLLGVRKGFFHLARHGEPRTLCGIEFPERSRRSSGGSGCGTCNWIRLGCP